MRQRKGVIEDTSETAGVKSDKETDAVSRREDDSFGSLHYEETPAGRQRNDAYQRHLRSQQQNQGGLVIWVLLAAVTALCIAAAVIATQTKPQKVFTPEELTHYNGTNGLYYLALLGDVFDVSKNADKFYGEKGGYAFFVGRDGSRGFITGEFEKDLNDEVSDFEPDACASLIGWRDFYHKEYTYRGKVVGSFYNTQGQPQPALQAVVDCAAKAKELEEERKRKRKAIPSCSMRWSQEEGGYLWCDDGLYPRKLVEYEDQMKGEPKKTERCACFKEVGWSDLRQLYPNCKPDSSSCQTGKAQS